MGHQSTALLFEHPREYFAGQVDGALKRLKFEPLPQSRSYLVDLLEHYMFSENLFPPEERRQDTLAEMWLKAQNIAGPQRTDLLKKLGDSSLYISGFFGESLSRKIVDIDYYVDMGGVAYRALASAADGPRSQMFGEFSARFGEFVDVLTCISQEALVQTDGDLLKLYSRYMATGSRLAEEQLVEKGLLVVPADLQKSKTNKM